MYRQRYDLFYVSDTNRGKFEKKEPWQKPISVYIATDPELQAAYAKWQADHPGNYTSAQTWSYNEPDGQAAIAATKARWEQAIRSALESGRVLPEAVASDARGTLQDMFQDLRQKVKVTNTLDAGNWRKGFTPENVVDARPTLLYQGRKLGILTDGFVLVKSKKAADEVLEPLIKRKHLTPEQLRSEEKKGTFPDINQLWPDMAKVKPMRIVAISQVPDEYGYIRAYLTDGDMISVINADKLALIARYFPDATMMQAEPSGPLMFVTKGGEKVAVVMPLFEQDHPQAVLEAIGKAPSVGGIVGSEAFQKDIERKYGAKVVERETRTDGFEYWRLSDGREVKVDVERPKGGKRLTGAHGVLWPTPGLSRYSEMGVQAAAAKPAPPPEPEHLLSDLVEHYQKNWGSLNVGAIPGESEWQWKSRLKRAAVARAVDEITEGFTNLQSAKDWLADMKDDAVMFTMAGYQYGKKALAEAVKVKNEMLSLGNNPWTLSKRDVMAAIGSPGLRYKDSKGEIWEFTGKHRAVGLAFEYEMKNVRTGSVSWALLRDFFDDHKKAVAAALSKGVPVDQRVLRDYPAGELDAALAVVKPGLGQEAGPPVVEPHRPAAIQWAKMPSVTTGGKGHFWASLLEDFTPEQLKSVGLDSKVNVAWNRLAGKWEVATGPNFDTVLGLFPTETAGKAFVGQLLGQYGQVVRSARRAPIAGRRHPAPARLSKGDGERLLESARAFESRRTPRSRAMDERMTNVRVIEGKDLTRKKLRSWKKRPGHMDIKGVDSPRLSK